MKEAAKKEVVGEAEEGKKRWIRTGREDVEAVVAVKGGGEEGDVVVAVVVMETGPKQHVCAHTHIETQHTQKKMCMSAADAGNPTPYTLHPTPYTLHPAPCTPHPTP